jgi:hypothetical protein
VETVLLEFILLFPLPSDYSSLMKSCVALQLMVPLLLFCLGMVRLQAADPTPDWRTWTSVDGGQIEAYLKEVLPDGIVIVRRDGIEFTASLSRFTSGDQTYAKEWLRKKTPAASDFRQLNFEAANLPDRYEIAGVENVRPGSNQPPEAGAVQTVLNAHRISFGSDLAGRIAARKPTVDEAISPRDLGNVLEPLPLATELIPFGRPSGVSWPGTLNAIRMAITWDLPVIIAYRPLFEPETPEEVLVVTGFDRRHLNVLEPFGSRRPIRLDLRNLQEQFVYGLVIFPEPIIPMERGTSATGPVSPPTALLSQISAVIGKAPDYNPTALTDFFREQGIQATIRDVNRSDLSQQLGQTRSFARSVGLPAIDASLDQGNVIVVPLELSEGVGLALLYGRNDNDFEGVEFLPNRTFRRTPIPRNDIANRWLSRENRTYRLDLIEISGGRR